MMAVEGKQELLQATLHLRGNVAQHSLDAHVIRSALS